MAALPTKPSPPRPRAAPAPFADRFPVARTLSSLVTRQQETPSRTFSFSLCLHRNIIPALAPTQISPVVNSPPCARYLVHAKVLSIRYQRLPLSLFAPTQTFALFPPIRLPCFLILTGPYSTINTAILVL